MLILLFNSMDFFVFLFDLLKVEVVSVVSVEQGPKLVSLAPLRLVSESRIFESPDFWFWLHFFIPVLFFTCFQITFNNLVTTTLSILLLRLRFRKHRLELSGVFLIVLLKKVLSLFFKVLPQPSNFFALDSAGVAFRFLLT